MRLREHLLTEGKGLRSWPPLWVCIDKTGPGVIEAEIGTLTRATIRDLGERRISMYMNDGSSDYLAHLLFDDPEFCVKIYTLLRTHIGKPIQEIGDIDID